MASEWDAERILGLLAARHPRDNGEWAFLPGLKNATGIQREERYFDAYAMNVWPSRGFVRVAYEIKVSRGDWFREIRDHEKRAPAMAASNEFWFVAPVGIIKVEELPEGTGLLEADAGGLKTKRAAPYREVAPPGLPFIASVLRDSARAAGQLDLQRAKAFKYAGRDLDVDGLLEAAGCARDEAKRRAAEEREERARARPERLLAEAVAMVMNSQWVTGGRLPLPDEFRAWAASMNGSWVPHPRLEQKMLAAVRAAEYAQRAVADASDALREMKEAQHGSDQ